MSYEEEFGAFSSVQIHPGLRSLLDTMVVSAEWTGKCPKESAAITHTVELRR
jgi:hypothetical protein